MLHSKKFVWELVNTANYNGRDFTISRNLWNHFGSFIRECLCALQVFYFQHLRSERTILKVSRKERRGCCLHKRENQHHSGVHKKTKMNLLVLRISSQSDSTSGLLFEKTDVGMKFLCYTLEDERRALKVKGETRVPAGTYNLKLRKEGGFDARYKKKYPSFHKGMIQVMDVPNFEYILIHQGNTDEHTAGCLLVGDSQENNIIIKDGFIGKSANAYKRIYPIISKQLELGNDVTITYQDYA